MKQAFAKLYDMRQFIETDFDKVYEALTRCYLTEEQQKVEINNVEVILDFPFVSAKDINWNANEYNNSGIYIFRCNANKDIKGYRYYIGQARNLAVRIRAHLRYHDKPDEDSRALHLALLKYYDKDPTTFDIGILEYTPIDLLNDREVYWIDKLQTYKNLKDYNLTIGGDSGPDPSKVTEEIYNNVYNALTNIDNLISQKTIAQENGISEERVSTINTNKTYYWNRLLHPDAIYPLRQEDIGNKERLQNIRMTSDNPIYKANSITAIALDTGESVKFITTEDRLAIISAADWIISKDPKETRKSAINAINRVVNGKHKSYKGFSWTID